MEVLNFILSFCFSIILNSFRKPALYYSSVMVIFFIASPLFLWCPRLRQCLIRSSITLNIVAFFAKKQPLNNMVSQGAQKSHTMEHALRY